MTECNTGHQAEGRLPEAPPAATPGAPKARGFSRGFLSGVFMRAAACLVAAAALAFDLEWGGYDAFQRDDGGNVLADIDPYCRSLTAGEVELARGMFGDSVDYGRVKIFDRPYFLVTGSSCSGMAPNGNIYISSSHGHSADFSTAPAAKQAFFLHEMTHVWQHQNGRDVRREAVQAWAAANFDYSATYRYKLESHTDFAGLSLEQQADVTGDYFRLRAFLEAQDFEAQARGWDRESWTAEEWRGWACGHDLWHMGVTWTDQKAWEAGDWRGWYDGQAVRLAQYERVLAPALPDVMPFRKPGQQEPSHMIAGMPGVAVQVAAAAPSP